MVQTLWKSFSAYKLNLHLPNDLTIPLLDSFPIEMKTKLKLYVFPHKNLYTNVQPLKLEATKCPPLG